ncbi:MAG: NAD-binding protein [Candidatus Latescibacteria bacterium]|nr:NAD-binding protein [Candidatus Latescibacterota bacterium]
MSATSPKATLGIIGLGAMGGPMTRNFLAAGYTVHAADLDTERLAAAQQHGALASSDTAALLAASDIVLTSLPSSDAFVALTDQYLVPLARPGQVFIDLGTTTPPETRRLAAALAQQQAALLDVPVSGGPGGAEKGTLFMFAGGQQDLFEQHLPLLQVLGDPDKITYCGPSGAGQVVKGVNQLMMGLVHAAHLEALAFGVRDGVAPEILLQALGSEGRWRRDLAQTTRAVAAGKGDEIGVKFRELPYFLRAAQDSNFPLPLTQLLYDFCDSGERVVIDDHRPAPSFWHQLMEGSYPTEE